MLLIMLGGRELWTLEARWADICWHMLNSGDYVHPNLGGTTYYDKPLLSYWLMLFAARLIGGLSVWALRLPSVLAGLVVLWCTFDIGRHLINRRSAFLAGWMLATTHFFIFWSRTASADMLNLAGIMAAVAWYVRRRDVPGVTTTVIFFLLLAVTSLFKGLVGAAVPVLVIAPHLCTAQRWRRYPLRSVILSAVPAAMVYLVPFGASTWFGNGAAPDATAAAGLYQVYRENILRYFAPFDHEGPVYTYLLYGPIYMLPWAIFLVPALWTLPRRWRSLSGGARWMTWSTLLIFIFFTLSGSRRSYYILPLVPFATLVTAEWVSAALEHYPARSRRLGIAVALVYVALLLFANVTVALYYCGGGSPAFGRELRAQATALRPWPAWKIVSLDARDKLVLYVDPAKPIEMLGAPPQGVEGGEPSTADVLLTAWPVLRERRPDTILITREAYFDKLAPRLIGYHAVRTPPSWGARLFKSATADDAVALIPQPPFE